MSDYGLFPIVDVHYATVLHGHWLAIDVRREVGEWSESDGARSHFCTYMLLNRNSGERMLLGLTAVVETTDGVMIDEASDTHSDIDAAVSSDCKQFMAMIPTSPRWVEHAPHHDLLLGKIAAKAF